MTRGQLLKGLHDNEEKISQLVEAAHAVRCTSNEKHSSTKKPNISVSDMWARINTAQNFGEKYSNHQQFLNAPQVSEFNLMGYQSSFSAERQSVEAKGQKGDENSNSMNIQVNNQSIAPKSMHHGSQKQVA